MVKIILMRHGQSEANKSGIFAGHLDIPLTELGEKQAQLSADYIVNNYKVDKIYASDLKRAYNTGKAVADILNMEIEAKENLREINAGEWDGLRFDAIETEYEEAYKVWCEDIGKAQCPGGEDIKAFSKRIISALSQIAEENEGKTVLVAIHATPIRVMQCICKNIAIEDMKDVHWVSNASISVIQYDEGTWTMLLESYDEHMGRFKTSLPANV